MNQSDTLWARSACCAIPPVEPIQPCREGGADQQIVVATPGWNGPTQRLSRSGEDLVIRFLIKD